MPARGAGMTKARSLWRVVHPDIVWGPVGTLEHVREWISLRKEQADHPRDASLYSIDSVPTCGCCGTEDGVTGIHVGRISEVPDAYRCGKHEDRNPCLVDGCGRTFANDGNYRIEFVCGKHFRLAPVAVRRGIKNIERLAKKHGWKLILQKRHEQLWARAVRGIKAALAGDIDVLDMAEINHVMGWDQ